MEVEASSLIPKVVRNLNSNKISDVGVNCWPGPLAINPDDGATELGHRGWR
jgi:hypothetical protein